MAPRKPKHPGGRPSVYQAEYADLARKFCLLGATDKDLAGLFEVCEATINNWKLEYPEFLEAIKNGKEIADATVADKLYHRAIGYKHDAVKIFNHQGEALIVPYTEHYPPETAAAIFFLKNRQRDKWRDRQDVESTNVNLNQDVEDIDPSKLANGELSQLITLLQKAAK